MSMVMEKSVDHKNNQCSLNINRDLSINVVNTIKEMLDAEIELYKDFEMVLGDVDDIDSAGIQLLIAFKNELEDKKKSLTLSSVSSPVAQLIEKYGISDNFSYGATR